MAFNFEINPVAINNITKTVENLKDSIKLQDKTVEIDSNGQEIVTADSEYDGLGKVTINTDVPTKPEEVLTETITENGLKTFNPTSGSVYSSASITVNVPEKKIEAEKTVTITENKETVITPTPDNAGMARVVVTTNIPQPTLEENKTQTISSNSVVEVTPSAGNDGMKKATITVSVPEKKIEANKTQSIVTNGETVITPTAGNDGMAKVTVNVNVPESVLQDSKSVNITENKTESVTPDEGFDAIKKVDVTVNIPLEEKKTQTISSNSTVTITPTEGNTAMKSVEVTVNVPSSGGDPSPLDLYGKLAYVEPDFSWKSSLESIDFSNTVSMKYMFAFFDTSAGSSSGSYLTFNVNKDTVTNWENCFQRAHCNAILPSKIIGGWVKDSSTSGFAYMFNEAYGTYSGLETIEASGAGYLNFSYMFKSTRAIWASFPDLQQIYLNETEGGTSKLTVNLSSMYHSCSLDKTVDINIHSDVRPFNVNVSQMFYNCDATTIGLINITSSKGVTYSNTASMFNYVTNIVTMKGIVNMDFNINLNGCANLSNESIQNLIDNAADVTSLGTKTMTFNATPFATITEEQRAAATAKGWTLASA